MDGGAAGEERQRAVRVEAFGELQRHVAVFDHVQTAAGEAEVAEFFGRAGLRQHAAADLRAFEDVQADEQRIGDRHERVVHLEIREVFHAVCGHFVEAAGRPERQQRAAVPVRGKRERILRADDELAVKPDGGHGALHEEADLAVGEPEEIVLLEELLRRDGVQLAAHDVPGQRRAVFFRNAADGFGEILEERLVQDGRDRVGALRTVKPEARALSARDRERGDFARAEDFHTLRRRFSVELFLLGRSRREREERGGREVGGDGGLRAFQDISGDQAGESFPVDHAELGFEFCLGGGVRGVVMREQMRLTGGFDAFPECFLHDFSPEK